MAGGKMERDGGGTVEEMLQGAARTVDGGREDGGTAVWRRRRRPEAVTCRFRASLKHKDNGQTKFIKPNSQR